VYFHGTLNLIREDHRQEALPPEAKARRFKVTLTSGKVLLHSRPGGLTRQEAIELSKDWGEVAECVPAEFDSVAGGRVSDCGVSPGHAKPRPRDRVWRLCPGGSAGLVSLLWLEEQQRRLDAVHSYIRNKKIRAEISHCQRWVELRIGEWLGPRRPGERTGINELETSLAPRKVDISKDHRNLRSCLK
jgi:hypothetical protein